MRLILVTGLGLLAALPAAADDLQARAVAMFEAAFSEDQCRNYRPERPAPQRRQVVLEDDISGPQTVTTFEFDCDFGAYNEVKAFLIHTEVDGLRVASFAAPVPDVHYAVTPDTQNDPWAGPVERIDIAGYDSSTVLINPAVDDTTGRIVTWEKWRGIGDAASSGTWDLTAGGYVLRRYEIDASYDGEHDPLTVLDLSD